MQPQVSNSSPSDAPGRDRDHGHRRWLELALILAIFFIAGGAPVPHVNETHYLTKAKHYWDPSYCPGDLFLDSADPHLTFYWTLGWLTRVASLPVVAWVGRVAAWSLLAVAWQRLVRAVTAAPWAAALSAALWVMLIELGNFAGEWVVGGIEAKCFAYGFIIFGLAAMARGHWKAPWIWFGLASAFHVLVGAWAVLAAFGVWLIEPRRGRLPLAQMLPALALGGFLSLAGLIPALALERGTPPSVASEAAQIYVFHRLPHHLAPLSLPMAELQMRLTRFGLLAAAFVALWAWAARREATVQNSNDRGEEAFEQHAALMRLIRFAGLSFAAATIGLMIEAVLHENPAAAARILRYYWFRQADVAVPLAVALITTSLTIKLLRTQSRLGLAAATIPLLACGWFLVSTVVKRVEEPRPPAVARMAHYRDWQDACAWIQKHTPADALFLIPRAGHSFKWYAARADVANYKDVPQDAASVVEWRRRCEELFPTVESVRGEPMVQGSPDQWGASRVRILARKYGATHVIARTYPPLDLPIAYPTNDQAESYYTVYETGVNAASSVP